MITLQVLLTPCPFDALFRDRIKPMIEVATQNSMNEASQQAIIFEQALEISCPEERDAFLDKACEGNAELRRWVDLLLEGHDGTDGFLPTRADNMVPSITPMTEGIGTQLDRYKLLQKIGEGGFGVVYMAEQKTPVRRRVALKIIKVGMDTNAVVARFEAERQALALMDHPNIAKVHDAGATESGRPYFVMELIKGVSITQYCKEAELTLRQRMELFIPVCQAIQHAHQKGVIHRDIKPSNVMVTLHDGTPVPKVIDFGIAKATQQELTQKTVFTQFNQILGTPAYMSPEQAEMSGLDIDTRTDVYSLGALLYEMLAGVPPFDAKELMQLGMEAMLRTIREREPIKPSTRLSTQRGIVSSKVRAVKSPSLSTDLDWIVLKALEKDRTRRYETANGLAEDIRRYLNNESVLAVEPTLGYQLEKFYVKHRMIVRATATVAVVLAVATGLSLWLAVRATRAEGIATVAMDQAEKDRQEAVEAKEAAEEVNYFNSIAIADRFIENGDIDRAKELLFSCPHKYRNWEWGRLIYLCHRELLTVHPFARGSEEISISPDNRLLMTVKHPTLKVWSIQSGQELYSFGTEVDPVDGWAEFSPTENRLLVKREKSLQMLNGETGETLYTIGGQIGQADFSPDGNRFVHSNEIGDGAVVRDTRTGDVILRLSGTLRSCQDLAFSPSGETIISQFSVGESDPSIIHVWDNETGEEVLKLLPGEWEQLWISPNANYYATKDKSGKVEVWEGRTGEFIFTLNTMAEYHAVSGWVAPRVLGWSTDERLFVNSQGNSVNVWNPETGNRQFRLPSRPMGFGANSSASIIATIPHRNTVDLWDSQTVKKLGELKGHSRQVTRIVFSQDGSLVASGSIDGDVKVWNALLRNNTIATTDGIYDGVYSPDGKTIATAQWDRSTAFFDADSGRKRFQVEAHMNSIQSVAFSPDGSWFVTGGYDDVARVWDATTPQLSMTLAGHEHRLTTVAVSPNGKRIATGGYGPVVILWDAETGQRLMDLRCGSGANRMLFNPGKPTLAVSCRDSTIKIWDMETGRMLKSLDGQNGTSRGIDFNKSGELLASVDVDATIRLWEVASGRISKIIRSRIPAMDIRFSNDDSRLFAASSHPGSDFGISTIDVWDVTTGRELLALKGHDSAILRIAVHPSERKVASFSLDNTIRQWECFPWKDSDYTEYEGTSFQDRVQAFAFQYWRERLLSETASSAADPQIFKPTFEHEFPDRDGALSPRHIDLTAWFNGKLDAMWLPVRAARISGDDLTSLPHGSVRLTEVLFDVRGVIQLANSKTWTFQKYFPNRINGIPVNQQARYLHFLHACDGWDQDGTQIGSYVIHYLDGSTEELKIIYGKDTRNWWYGPRVLQAPHSEDLGAKEAAIAWQGANHQSQKLSRSSSPLRLFRKSYENPKPGKTIAHIDFSSALTQAAPFLIALTVTDEPVPMIANPTDSTRTIRGETAEIEVDPDDDFQ